MNGLVSAVSLTNCFRPSGAKNLACAVWAHQMPLGYLYTCRYIDGTWWEVRSNTCTQETSIQFRAPALETSIGLHRFARA